MQGFSNEIFETHGTRKLIVNNTDSFDCKRTMYFVGAWVERIKLTSKLYVRSFLNEIFETRGTRKLIVNNSFDCRRTMYFVSAWVEKDPRNVPELKKRSSVVLKVIS